MGNRVCGTRRLLFFGLLFAALAGQPTWAQIGGKTAADGPFILDTFEDLDTTAGGVLRAWIGQGSNVPEPVDLSTASLTLATGQSPIGALGFDIPSRFNYINSSFGVPMPAVAGASTLTDPGNITSFGTLTFLTAISTSITSATFQVILECYPEANPGEYPKVYWNYVASPGPTFTPVTIDLWNPSFVQNAGTLTLFELLSKTRYLSFYYYGGPEFQPTTLSVRVDDIRLLGLSGVKDWSLYH